MPKKTLKALQDAISAKKQAEARHNEATNQLLVVVKRIMLEINQDVPGFAESLKINGPQTLLGQDFAEILSISQEVAGVTIDPEEIAKLTARSIALDVAMAMNNGTEVEYNGPTREAVWFSLPGYHDGSPWVQLGNEYNQVIEAAKSRGYDVESSALSPTSTLNELMLALKSVEAEAS